MGERVCLVPAALWSETRRLNLRHTSAWDSVRIGQSDESNECQGVSVPDLMRSQGISMVDILKLDIEDAELGLFSADCDSWLSQIRTIAWKYTADQVLKLWWPQLSDSTSHTRSIVTYTSSAGAISPYQRDLVDEAQTCGSDQEFPLSLAQNRVSR